MPKYKVKLEFCYTDIVHVEAVDEEEAEEKALDGCQEEYDRYLDCQITEEYT